MSKQEFKLTAYCGLYCGDCIRYKSEASNLARDLIFELQDAEFGKYAEVKSVSSNAEKQLKQYRECCEVLEAIVRLQCNDPCRVGGGCPTFDCGIVACCQKKGFQGCWECEEFKKCKEFDSLKPFHGNSPRQNLEHIKELGLENWAEHRHKFFLWQ